jgi:hypothetical protein
MYATLEKSIRILSSTLALAGGFALIALTAITCISILGRVLVPLDIGIGPHPRYLRHHGNLHRSRRLCLSALGPI